MSAAPAQFPTATILAYPRIGRQRQLKRALEARWAGRITEAELIQAANDLRKENLARLVEALQDTVKAMENDEQDAEAIQENLQTKLQAAAMPSNATTGSGPYSYNAPTSSLPPINTSTSQEG